MNFSRVIYNKFLSSWMRISITVIILIPFAIGIALLLKSLPIIRSDSIFNLVGSGKWAPSEGKFGFRPYILSSVYVTLFSFLFAAPVSFLSAIYLTQFARGRLIKLVYPVIDILAGIPSVIYGVWGVLVIVPFISGFVAPVFNTSSSGFTILAGGIVLAVMCIPYMLNMLLEVLKTVPTGLKEATLSLGATNWETTKHVVLRNCFSGVVSSFGLGITKAFGETLAVMMVVGNTVHISFNPLQSGYPLPALIANNYGEMLSIPLYDSALMFAALLLMTIILVINLFFRFLMYRAVNQ
ncbi:MAG: phosphate ABC transporter permease subunit PstC [Bacteroidales bacterium]|nr:phosphate ABC transporter permease subunit PstC [Bacteroidales bacterium]MBN2820100.1 phosphate ABC transporter permease subunit PstC [Bacteroidales bacterium]